MELVEPREETYALWISKEDFTLFDSLFTEAGYKTISNSPIRDFTNHYGYFIVDKKDKTIGFMETLIFSIYQDKECGIRELLKSW